MVPEKASGAGRCALSGQAISTGEANYQPRATDPPPLNRNAMILAACVEGLVPWTDPQCPNAPASDGALAREVTESLASTQLAEA